MGRAVLVVVALLGIVLAVLYMQTFESGTLPLEELRARASDNSLLLQLSGGRVLEYLDMGDRSSSTVLVLLHGIASSCHMHHAFIKKQLPGSLRLLSVSMPGWGASSWSIKGMDVSQDLLELFHHLKFQRHHRVSLVGVSMGTMYAVMSAFSLPLLDQLHLVDPGVPGNPGFSFEFPNLFARLMAVPPLSRLLPYYVSPLVDSEKMGALMFPDEWDEFCYSGSGATPNEVCREFKADAKYASSIYSAGNVEAFPLVVWQPHYQERLREAYRAASQVHVWVGSRDALASPQSLAFLRQQLPEAQFHYKDKGHMSNIAPALQDIFDSLESGE